MKDYPIVDTYPNYTGSPDPAMACRYFAGKFADLDRADRLLIYVTNKAEQDDEDLERTVDRLCPNLFPRVLTTLREEPE